MHYELDTHGRITYLLDNGAKVSVEPDPDGERLVVRSRDMHALAVLPHVSNVVLIEPMTPRGLRV